MHFFVMAGLTSQLLLNTESDMSIRTHFVLIVALLGLTACKPETETDPRLATRLVQVATVEPLKNNKRTFTGTVAARVQSNLGFRVAGKVIERLVDTGQSVHSGDPLMRIDQTDLDLVITNKEKAVAAAKAVALQATADEARYAQLQREGWATAQKYEQVKANLDTANAQLSAAEADAQVARNNSSYATLLADADGVVVETLVEPGQVVNAGQVVVRLAHSGSREAAVDLPENLRPRLGSKAEASLYGNSATFSASLRQLSDSADPRTRTFEARYVLEGDRGARAPLGVTISVSIPVPDFETAIQVPMAAIQDSGKGPAVWVIDGQTMKVSRHSVQIRQISSAVAVLDGGVTGGELIVASGGHVLIEGQTVRIADQKAAMQ